MKRTIVLVVIAVLVSVSLCWADEITKEQITEARIDVAKKVVGFGAGFVAGGAFHELSHAVVAKIEDVHMEWGGFTPRWTAYTNDSGKLRNIAFAGFGGEILSSEIILGVPAIPKDNAFVLGWLAWDILDPILYTLQDSLQKGGYGDIETLRNNGVNTDLMKVGLIAHALVTAYRLYKDPKFVPYVTVTKKEVVLGFSFTF